MPNDPSTAGLAMYYVRKAIEKWEKRVTIEKIDAEPDTEYPERLNLMLRYTIKKLNVHDELQFTVKLT